ncbi:hypothetical protein C8A05DRAFT_39069 [Staphylotrichum tortipilum]|uniref:Uncharacterized protein n=1 Tax=Staphylotrichum tortipilum TaxID=2831512 RepID=A0AAN6RPG8_9PEZI|nr:hypothetical protein C8A05DRAFT_39069 [Staphylotrichum longicolle]
MALPHGASTAALLRTVLVKVSPAPISLSERRAILHVVKKHAKVDVFKKLYDPSHFISILATPQMATSLKTFLVKITPSPSHAHKTTLRASPLHGRWPAPQQQALFDECSVARAALRRVVPGDMAFAGLTDWEGCGQLRAEEDGPAVVLGSRRSFVERRRRGKGRVWEGSDGHNPNRWLRLEWPSQAETDGKPLIGDREVALPPTCPPAPSTCVAFHDEATDYGRLAQESTEKAGVGPATARQPVACFYPIAGEGVAWRYGARGLALRRGDAVAVHEDAFVVRVM